MLMRFGAALNSGWCPEAFTPETVLKICSCACPKFKIIASPSVVAGRMNDAAGHLLLALDAEASPKEGKEWADELARSAIAFRNACGGGRPMRTVLLIGIDANKLRTMLQTVAEVQGAAVRFAAAAAERTRAGRPARRAVGSWLRDMEEIFEFSYRRPAGTVTTHEGKRGGPTPRFIAEVATHLLTNLPETPRLSAALGPLRSPETVARSMVSLSGKPRIAAN
jgi:hypothetical protein